MARLRRAQTLRERDFELDDDDLPPFDPPVVTQRYAPPKASGEFALHWHGEPDDAPLKEWLVDKTLPKAGKALLSGQWGTYKTFAAFDLAGAVMTKATFAGRRIMRQGGVLFLAAEGQDEVRVRLEGVAREKVANVQIPNDAVTIDPTQMPFAWAEACPRLTADDAADQLSTIARLADAELRQRFGLPLALIVIDTLMPAAGFKDANDASETQRVMTALTKLATGTDVLVLAVDHFGKDISTGTRNSSVKEDAVDAVMALIAERDLSGKVSNPRLCVRKVRGAPTGDEIPFDVRAVTIHENAGHDAVTTLVVDWRAPKTTEAQSIPSKRERVGWPKSLAILKRALDFGLANAGIKIRPFPDGPEVPAAKRDTVRTEFLKACPGDTLKLKGQAFRRDEKKAVGDGLMHSRDVTIGGVTEAYLWPMTSAF